MGNKNDKMPTPVTVIKMFLASCLSFNENRIYANRVNPAIGINTMQQAIIKKRGISVPNSIRNPSFYLHYPLDSLIYQVDISSSG
jgi:hypothetical protein